MQIDEVLCNRQPEAGALLGRFDGVRSLAERGEHDRYLLLGDAVAGVLDADILAPRRGPTGFEPNLATAGRELDGIAQEIEADLAHCPHVCPQPRHVTL